MNTLRILAIAGLLAGLLVLEQVTAQDVPAEDTGRIAKRLFVPCAACHSLEIDGPQNGGPSLYGVLGRKAGSSAGFDYSEAMKQSNVIWSERTLDEFLKNPQAAMPGNKMAYLGVPQDADRKALIEYLKKHSSPP